jgi:hypothetical protein
VRVFHFQEWFRFGTTVIGNPDISGSFQAMLIPGTTDEYQITSVYGTVNSPIYYASPIQGLSNYGGADNILYFPANIPQFHGINLGLVDTSGISVSAGGFSYWTFAPANSNLEYEQNTANTYSGPVIFNVFWTSDPTPQARPPILLTPSNGAFLNNNHH